MSGQEVRPGMRFKVTGWEEVAGGERVIWEGKEWRTEPWVSNL